MRAVAFLISRFPVGSVLQDTDDRNNDADNCYYNTHDPDSKLYCQIYYVPFIVFSIFISSVSLRIRYNLALSYIGSTIIYAHSSTIEKKCLVLFFYNNHNLSFYIAFFTIIR